MSDNYQNIIGAVLIIVVLGGGYWWYSGGSEPSDDGPSLVAGQPGSESALAADSEILSLLEDLREIDFNERFLTSSEFRSLQDFSIDIQPQPLGRDNPFAPRTFVPSGDTVIRQTDNTQNQPASNTATSSTDGSDSQAQAGAENQATSSESGSASGQ